MFYREELLNLDNPKEYRFALKLMYESQVYNDPILECLYFKEFGPKEKFEEAKKRLETTFEIIDKHQKSLKEKLNTLSKTVSKVSEKIFIGVPIIITVGRERRQHKEKPI